MPGKTLEIILNYGELQQLLFLPEKPLKIIFKCRYEDFKLRIASDETGLYELDPEHSVNSAFVNMLDKSGCDPNDPLVVKRMEVQVQSKPSNTLSSVDLQKGCFLDRSDATNEAISVEKTSCQDQFPQTLETKRSESSTVNSALHQYTTLASEQSSVSEQSSHPYAIVHNNSLVKMLFDLTCSRTVNSQSRTASEAVQKSSKSPAKRMKVSKSQNSEADEYGYTVMEQVWSDDDNSRFKACDGNGNDQAMEASEMDYSNLNVPMEILEEDDNVGFWEDKCAVCCQEESPTLFLHRFPLDPNLSDLWAAKCGPKFCRETGIEERHEKYRICSNHFQETDYDETGCLQSEAVPSRNCDGLKWGIYKNLLVIAELPDSHLNGTEHKGGQVHMCALCYRKRSHHRFLHNFPRQDALSDEWAKACNRPWITKVPPGKRHQKFKLCMDHFRPRDHSKFRLKQGAVPSRIPPMPEPVVLLETHKKKVLSDGTVLEREKLVDEPSSGLLVEGLGKSFAIGLKEKLRMALNKQDQAKQVTEAVSDRTSTLETSNEEVETQVTDSYSQMQTSPAASDDESETSSTTSDDEHEACSMTSGNESETCSSTSANQVRAHPTDFSGQIQNHLAASSYQTKAHATSSNDRIQTDPTALKSRKKAKPSNSNNKTAPHRTASSNQTQACHSRSNNKSTLPNITSNTQIEAHCARTNKPSSIPFQGSKNQTKSPRTISKNQIQTFPAASRCEVQAPHAISVRRMQSNPMFYSRHPSGSLSQIVTCPIASNKYFEAYSIVSSYPLPDHPKAVDSQIRAKTTSRKQIQADLISHPVLSTDSSNQNGAQSTATKCHPTIIKVEVPQL